MFSKLLLAFLLVPALAFPQSNYVFQHLTADEGLSSDSKINIYQDDEGFYWFNSISGIQRYDGRNFISYTYENKNGKDILDNWTGKPVEDKEKNLWVITKNGISVLSSNMHTMHRMCMLDAKDSSSNNVAGILKDEENRIWIFTNKNIFLYDAASKKYVLIKNVVHNNSDSIAKVIYNAADKNFLLLVGGNFSQLLSFNTNTKRLAVLINSVDALLGHSNPISFIQTDNNNNLWTGNFIGDLCRYNLKNGITGHYNILHQKDATQKPLPNAVVHDCLNDENVIWFACENYIGLLCYDKLTDKFSCIQNNNGAEYALHYNENVYNLFKDNEGNIWVNTDLGMNIFNPKNQLFKYVATTTTDQFNTDVTDIFQSNNKHIWISTWGDGIFEYDSNFVLLKNYKHIKNNTSSLGDTLNRVWCLAEDAKGRIWAGCQFAMLSVLDISTGKFINKKIESFNNKTILHEETDKQHNIWFSLHNGVIAKWDAAKDSIIVYKDLYKPVKPLSIIEGFCFDESNNIWAATRENGLIQFNTRLHYVDESALLPYHIFSPSILNDSLIAGGTAGSGLFAFNKLSRSVQFYTTQNGLSSNIIFGVVAGDNDDVWVLASNGIEHLNLKTGKCYLFNINDGIHDHVFARTICKLRNGNIVIASNSGIIYFNPADIKTRLTPPDVIITNFSASEKNLALDSLLLLKNIKLSHNQNVISVAYASLSFSGAKTDTYFYKLEPSDKNWIAAGMQRSVTYANLSPGNYVFKVKAHNADGIETKNITQLNIIILSPWWQTWWACIIWLLIVAFIIYNIYAYRKKNRLAVAAMRQKIASDLHDDIGSTLNSISVYSEVAVKNLNTDADKAKTLIYKMGDVSRNMIDTMNDIVWSINPKNDQFENILQRMKFFAGELLSGKNILLEFTAAESIKNIKLPMEKRKNFYLIFKESINNAYKYSGSNVVWVSISEASDKLTMIIKDSGIGFNNLNKNKGNGMENMRARAKEIHAAISIKSETGKGTTVELIMPIK